MYSDDEEYDHTQPPSQDDDGEEDPSTPQAQPNPTGQQNPTFPATNPQMTFEQMMQTPLTPPPGWNPAVLQQYMQGMQNFLWTQGVMPQMPIGQPSMGEPSSLGGQPSMAPPANYPANYPVQFQPPIFDPYNLGPNYCAGQQPFTGGHRSSTSSSVGPRAAPTQERRSKWPPAVDMLLISAWLRTSRDGIRGTSQAHDTFWKSVLSKFNRAGKFREGEYTMQAVKTHYNKSQRRVKRYLALLEKEKAQESHSGWNDERFRERAMELYKLEVDGIKNEPKVFKLHHWIGELTEDERFWADEGTAGAQRRKLDAEGSYSTTPPRSNPTDDDFVTGLGGDDDFGPEDPPRNEDPPIGEEPPTRDDPPIRRTSPPGMPLRQERPIGTKAAKSKGKSKMSEKVSVMQMLDEGRVKKSELFVTLDAKMMNYVEELKELKKSDTSQYTDEQREVHTLLLSTIRKQISKVEKEIEALQSK